MSDTTRQRYALLKLFADKPNRQLTRREIMDSTENPFYDKNLLGKIPTILRERLDDLVAAELIERKKSGKEVAYQLRKDFGKGLFESPVAREADVEYLKRMESILDKFSELPISAFIGTLAEKADRLFDSRYEDIEEFVVADLETPFVKDERFRSLVEGLFYAISDRFIIPEITHYGNYFSGKDPEKKTVTDFMPYVLKQSRGQWYLVGKCKGDKEFRAIPVNRIIGDVNPDEECSFTRERFDPVQYWDGCAGITRLGSPMNISFEVKNGPIYNNVDYIRMIPIVKGHQSVSFRGEWMNVSLERIYLGPELVRIIRSFGRENIRSVKPAWLAEDLWETGKREDVRFSIAFRDGKEAAAWRSKAVSDLQAEPGGENSAAAITVAKAANKHGFYPVTLNNVLVSSGLYFFMKGVIRKFGEKRLNLRNRSFLK